MTVPAQTTYTQATGNGVTTAFPFGFLALRSDEVLVSLDGVPLADGAGYSVSGLGVVSGGAINFTLPPAAGVVVLIQRNMQFTRSTDYQYQGQLPAATVNADFDRVWMALQQLGFLNFGAVRAPFPEQIPALPRASTRAGKLLGFDPLGNPVPVVPNDQSVGSYALTLLSSIGSSLIGFIQTGLGATYRAVQDKLRERVSVADFAGCDPTGATDSTAAFNAAKAAMALRGGGCPRIPLGTYMLTDFDLDVQRVIFDGDTGGYTYEKIPDPTRVGVRLIPGPGARWVFRIKGVTPGNAGASAQGSGLKNAVIVDTSPGAHLIGLLEDSAGVVLEDVTVQGFQYGHVMPGGTNGNKHTRVAVLGCTKVGVVRSEYQAAPYMWPEIPDVPQLGHTVIFRDGCVTRQNEFGIVDRDGIGGCFANETVESNAQAGLYYYRADVSTVRGVKWDGPHFENNYDGVQKVGGVLVRPDGSPYTITGNRAFLIGNASTYIAWDPTVLAGAQVVIDSQTHGGTGGPDGLHFSLPKFNCNNPFQRDLEVLCGTSTVFERPNFGGTGDEPNRVRCRADANGTVFYMPTVRNDPNADVLSLVSGYGANLGMRGVLIRPGTRNGDLGGMYSQFGVWGGAVHLPGLPAGDPRRADFNTLHRYAVLDAFAIPWRTASALPFTLTAEDNTSTLIGREVTIKCEGSMTVSTATASPDKFFANATLPYQTVKAGKVVGQVVIKPTGGGATVVNNGCSPMEMNAIASAISVLDVFPALVVGMTFSYQVELSYTLAP